MSCTLEDFLCLFSIIYVITFRRFHVFFKVCYTCFYKYFIPLEKLLYVTTVYTVTVKVGKYFAKIGL